MLLSGKIVLGVGTNLKFYIGNSGNYYDITPLKATRLLGANPLATDTATNSGGFTTVTVTDASGGFSVGDYVTISGATAVAGVTVSGEYAIQSVGATAYTLLVSGAASSSTSGGGSGVYAAYQIGVGPAYNVPVSGWGAGAWGAGPWGTGSTSSIALRLWSQSPFGEDLVFGPRGGGIYYWKAALGYEPSAVTFTIAAPAVATLTINGTLAELTAVSFYTTGTLPTGLTPGTIYYARNVSGLTCNLSATPTGALITTSGTQTGTHYLSPRGILASSLSGATSVPVIQNLLFVSDSSRFVFAFGCNDYGSTTLDPLLVRWSDQESLTDWMPSSTNQAGSIRLSHGSTIVTLVQSRQEILVFTDSSLYSMQYVGAPVVWSNTLVGDNISIAGQNAAAYANGVTYWMGLDKFYKYDGRVQTLRCDLRQYIYGDINSEQFTQVYAGTNEGFNEAWWFYCSAGSTVIDKYVVYNYLEDVWYYGTMGRTAWLDTGILNVPVAATYSNNLVEHETGCDDATDVQPIPIVAYITSAEFDIDDGDHFAFVYRMLPDITFRGSTVESPGATMYLYPLANSGSGYNDPVSEGGNAYADVTRIKEFPVEEFTGQVYIRVRGRQMAMKVQSSGLGVQWQLGSPRIDLRQDGRRGN